MDEWEMLLVSGGWFGLSTLDSQLHGDRLVCNLARRPASASQGKEQGEGSGEPRGNRSAAAAG